MMMKAGTLREQAEAKGISERALIIDAIDGAADYAEAARKLNVSRQALNKAMERVNVKAQRVSRLQVVIQGQKEGVS